MPVLSAIAFFFFVLIQPDSISAAITCYNTEAAYKTGLSQFATCFEEHDSIDAFCYSKSIGNVTVSSGCTGRQHVMIAGRMREPEETTICRDIVKDAGSGACRVINGQTICCCTNGHHCGAEKYRHLPQIRCQLNELIDGDIPTTSWCVGEYCYRYNRLTGCYPSHTEARKYWIDRFQIKTDHFKCESNGCRRLPGENAGIFCCCKQSDGCEQMYDEFVRGTDATTIS